jgi:hypothetical protein
MHDAVPGKPHRLFFAVWPGASGRAAIASVACEVARTAGGRATLTTGSTSRSHFGEQQPRTASALHRLGGGIKAPAFVYSRRSGLFDAPASPGSVRAPRNPDSRFMRNSSRIANRRLSG